MGKIEIKMGLWGLAFATAQAGAGAETVGAEREGTPARPAASPATWINSDDYPLEAMLKDQKGVTGFRLEVDEAGMVSKCSVTQSSGSVALDNATCSAIGTRARFIPARTPDGVPTKGIFASKVRWEMPSHPSLPLPREISGSLVVEKNGQVTNCHLLNFELDPAESYKGEAAASLREYAERAFCMSHPAYRPYVDKNGTPIRKRMLIRQTIATETLPD